MAQPKLYIENPKKEMISAKGQFILALLHVLIFVGFGIMFDTLIKDKTTLAVCFGILMYVWGRLEQGIRDLINYPKEVEIESVRQVQ